MNDPVRQLYSERRYPALSHPVTDISRLAVSARVAGMQRLAMPVACRVLEFGCASGHNLLPLAARYPKSEFTGIDYSDTAIRAARQAAYAAGLENIRFEVADLEHWRPSHPCDYLIAHGVLSWVPDAVKARLLASGDQRITAAGVVIIKAQRYRTQDQNRDDALARLQALVDAAAVVPRIRRATKPTKGSQRRRVDSKVKRGQIKSTRGKVVD